MKKNLFISIIAAASLVLSGLNVSAEDGQDNNHQDNNGEESDCQGGQIDGSESLIASVALVPSTNAPSGAGGRANLISDNEDGIVTASLSLSITGLTSGTYSLALVKKSDGATVDLGQFSIGDSGQEGDDEGDGDNNDGDHEKKGCAWAVFLSEKDVQLPAHVDPMDIGQIIVSDSNGNVLLIGDLVNPAPTTSIKFKAALRVGPGSVSLQTTGKAQAKSIVKRGKRSDRFTLIASGVAANSTFTVSVNGQAAGTVKSNRKGKVLVRKLPANLLNVRSVHLVDGNGQTALKAKF
jgi:hypothetical protein